MHHDLFRTLGLEVTEGRGSLPSDAPPAEPVGLADAAPARRIEGSPLGTVVRSRLEQYRIAGVVPEVRSRERPPFPVEGSMFVPFGNSAPFPFPRPTQVVARLREPPGPDALLAIRNAAHSTDSALRVLKLETATCRRAALLGADAIATPAVGIFGAAGLLLALGSVVGQARGDLGRRAGWSSRRRPARRPVARSRGSSRSRGSWSP